MRKRHNYTPTSNPLSRAAAGRAGTCAEVHRRRQAAEAARVSDRFAKAKAAIAES